MNDSKKCSVRKVAITNGHSDGLGRFVVAKMDKQWKELKQLDNDPTYDDVRNISRTTYILIALPRFEIVKLSSLLPRCEIVFIIVKIIIFVITFIIQVGTAVVQKRTCGYYNPSIFSLIVFFILLAIGQIINCIFLTYISKLDTYQLDLPFYNTLVIVFGIEMPMMMSNAFVRKSCGRVEAWTLALHISYIGHMWLAWILDSLHVKFKGSGSWSRLFIRIILSFFLLVVMYVPVYLKLGDKVYDFQLDISKVGGGSTDIERFIRDLLI